MSFFSCRHVDLAVDLGTVNTCVFARSTGRLVSEPSLVAVNRTRSRIEAFGAEAREMLGRTTDDIVGVKPMQDGVIADTEAVEHILLRVIERVGGRSRWRRPRLAIGVPSELTALERRAVSDCAARTQAAAVHLIQEPVLAAIGAGIPVRDVPGNMVVDVGGGTTDIAVISRGTVVIGRSLRIAGNEMDEAVLSYVRRAHGLLIGERTAERIKVTIGSAMPLDMPLTMEVTGRDLVAGVPKTVVLTDMEIRGALADTVQAIVGAVREALERVPPELCADIADRGLLMSGGGSLLRNLAARLRVETQLPVQTAEEPLSAVVMGASMALEDAALLQTVTTH